MKLLVIRAREACDIEGLTALVNQPGVRFGTLRLPFVSRDVVKGWMDRKPTAALVAELAGRVVGGAALMRGEGRMAHSGSVALSVHDDHVNSGTGSALLAALLDLADNAYGLRRVTLTVNADNARAIHVYEKFGFEIEGRLRGDVLRDGVFIDNLAMARLRF